MFPSAALCRYRPGRRGIIGAPRRLRSSLRSPPQKERRSISRRTRSGRIRRVRNERTLRSLAPYDPGKPRASSPLPRTGQARVCGRSGDSAEREGSTCRNYSTYRRAHFRSLGRILPRQARGGEGSNRTHIARASAHRADSENSCRTDVPANASGNHGAPARRHRSALWSVLGRRA